MTGIDDDRELDDFLARRSVHHRRLADRDRIDPPAELDRLVLNKAREAIDVPASAPVYRAPRWALPVALAATVLLAFAVVLNMSRLPNRGIPLATATPEADVSSSTALADSAASETDESFGPAREAAPPFAPEPPATDAVAAQSRDQARASDVALAKARTVAPAAPSAAAAPAVVMPREVAEASDKKSLTASAGARAYSPPAQTRAIVPAKGEMTVSNTQDAEARRFRKEDNAAGAGADAPALDDVTVTTGAAVVKDGAPPLSAEAKRANPQAWLRVIKELQAQGKAEEAARELAEFRKLFPAEAARFQARDPRPAQ